jgi:general stress protein 26
MDKIPDNIQHLKGREAIEKLQELANEETCHFCTFTGGGITARPMRTQLVDDDGAIWFFSAKSSEKNQEIQQNSKVQLLYGHSGKQNYVSIEGEASISIDRQKIEELWSPLVKTWFQEGKDDPELTLIKVDPVHTYYWDTKHGKMVAFAKMLASVVTGKTMDDSIEGKLKI